MARESLLTVTGLSKVYGQQKALDGVDITIYKGEICGLVGQNGAGKTTLIRILSGLIKPTSGQIVRHRAYRLGALIESPTLYPNLSAYDNLMYAALQLDIARKEERIGEVLRLVGLEAVDRKKTVKHYSLGMRQRMAIALAIIDFPDFLILDEPINGLDPSGIKEMREIITNLRDRYGMTILISSHILSELELIADRFVIMHQGKVLKTIDREALRAEVVEKILVATTDNALAISVLAQQGMVALGRESYLEVPVTYRVHEVLICLVSAGLEITDIFRQKENFEAYYLGLVEE